MRDFRWEKEAKAYFVENKHDFVEKSFLILIVYVVKVDQNHVTS